MKVCIEFDTELKTGTSVWFNGERVAQVRSVSFAHKAPNTFPECEVVTFDDPPVIQGGLIRTYVHTFANGIGERKEGVL